MRGGFAVIAFGEVDAVSFAVAEDDGVKGWGAAVLESIGFCYASRDRPSCWVRLRANVAKPSKLS